jgi:hypothetical protein
MIGLIAFAKVTAWGPVSMRAARREVTSTAKVPQWAGHFERHNGHMLALIASLALTQQSNAGLPPTIMPDMTGESVQLPDPNAKATVMLFIAVDCPISNRYAPELGRICQAYKDKGVSFYRVYLDDSFTKDEILSHGKEFKMPNTAFLDMKHKLVDMLGMTVTPEAAVVSSSGTILYRGRIDDLYLEHGRVRDGEYRRDLRVALDEFLAGKPISKPFTTAIGCGIPGK